jgi:hypothetical protein
MKILQSRSSFIVLQILDFLTTLVAFRFGAFEINPIVGHLTVMFGPIGGLLCSKLIAIFIAAGVRKRLWIVNTFYTGIVCWNMIIVWLLTRTR